MNGSVNLVLPVDVVIPIKEDAPYKTEKVEEIPHDHIGVDIGENS